MNEPRTESDVMCEPTAISDPLVIFRRAVLWTLLCAISAAPSFWLAAWEYSRPGMATGVGIFVALYTVVTSTRRFDLFTRRPFVRRTLYIGYGLRLICSVFFPLAILIDFLPGLVSVGITENVFGRDRSFVPTLITTLLDGVFLNSILGTFMLIVYGLQRAFCEPPVQDDGRCERCGYDLRASYQFGRCPECGTPCKEPVGR